MDRTPIPREVFYVRCELEEDDPDSFRDVQYAMGMAATSMTVGLSQYGATESGHWAVLEATPTQARRFCRKWRDTLALVRPHSRARAYLAARYDAARGELTPVARAVSPARRAA